MTEIAIIYCPCHNVHNYSEDQKARALGGVAITKFKAQSMYILRVCGHVTEIKVGVRGCSVWKELQAIQSMYTTYSVRL